MNDFKLTTIVAKRRVSQGFSLIELLSVLVIIAILAALLLSSLAKAKEEGKSIACLSNLKQLQAAYAMYVHDNREWLPQNISTLAFPEQVNLRGSWVLGNAKADTNTLNIQAGSLFNYLRSTEVYHCPADNSIVTDAPSLQRTRSYAIQAWLNCEIHAGTYADTINNNPLNLHKFNQLVNPPPSKTWVVIDEHPQTIDDGLFIIGNPWAFPGPKGPDLRDLGFWASYPADRHRNGANLSFAEGHVEHHKWVYQRTKIGNGRDQILINDAKDHLDLAWLQEGLPHSP